MGKCVSPSAQLRLGGACADPDARATAARSSYHVKSIMHFGLFIVRMGCGQTDKLLMHRILCHSGDNIILHVIAGDPNGK